MALALCNDFKGVKEEWTVQSSIHCIPIYSIVCSNKYFTLLRTMSRQHCNQQLDPQEVDEQKGDSYHQSILYLQIPPITRHIFAFSAFSLGPSRITSIHQMSLTFRPS